MFCNLTHSLLQSTNSLCNERAWQTYFSPERERESFASVPFSSSSHPPDILGSILFFWIFFSSLISSERNSANALSPIRHWDMMKNKDQMDSFTKRTNTKKGGMAVQLVVLPIHSYGVSDPELGFVCVEFLFMWLSKNKPVDGLANCAKVFSILFFLIQKLL